MSFDRLFPIDSLLVKAGRAAVHQYAPPLHHFDNGECLHLYHAQVSEFNNLCLAMLEL